jgi:type 1 glutamine amidotransferase
VTGEDEEKVSGAAAKLADWCHALVDRTGLTLSILGPAPAALARIKERWRWHVVVRGAPEEIGRFVRYAAPRVGKGSREVRVVIWLNDMPHTAAQRQAFERYMGAGGGWLGFHVSGFGTNAWPWFTEFMGGVRFSANNWPSLPARLNADDPAHAILKGVPATFVAPISEWYSWTPSPRANPDVKVLLTLDPSNFPLGVKNTLNGGDVPVAWTNTRYRMVYVNYGHGDRIYSAPPLPTMIDNILRWLLSR